MRFFLKSILFSNLRRKVVTTLTLFSGSLLDAEKWMDDLQDLSSSSQSISISIPEFGKITFNKIQSIQHGEDMDFSWSGKTTGSEEAFLTFARISQMISGSLTLPNDFRKISGSIFAPLLTKTSSNPRACKSCLKSGSIPRDPRRALQPQRSWRNGDAGLIDLLVVYPPSAVEEAGSIDSLEAEIHKSVIDANLCFRNSQVFAQVRIVHLAEVDYQPTGILETDLGRLQEDADGYMDEVHSLRDEYGADLVCLITSDSDSGGLANTMSHPSLNFAEEGFNISVWDQIAAPDYTLAHEIGHNMGCLHNREDDASGEELSQYDFNSFSFGKRWISNGIGYRTVMSYDDDLSTYSEGIPYFSNPSVSYLGISTGNLDSEDNAQVLMATAPYVSNFRSSVVPAILPTVFSLEVPKGDFHSFSVRLTVQPEISTTCTLVISHGSGFSLGSSSNLIFDESNWNLNQPVLIHALIDDQSDQTSGILEISADGMESVQVSLSSIEPEIPNADTRLFSGVVINELGIGISGVELELSEGMDNVQSDENGTFGILLPDDWSGTVTVSMEGHSMSPSSFAISTTDEGESGIVIQSQRSSVLYVDADAIGANDGSSWTNAYVELPEALLAKESFSEIWVAEGTYLAGSFRPASFLLPPNIPVYGGFVGNETLLSQRNAELNPTILSGDLGTAGIQDDNSYHVVIPSEGSVLDGFTIRDGFADQNFADDDRGIGASLWADGASFVVRNCTFTESQAEQGGGGIYLKDAQGTFTNCIFSNLLTGETGSGAAAYLDNSTAIFSYCSFSSNDADYFGGAIRSDTSIIEINDSNFTANRSISSNGGGAIYLFQSQFTINSCFFSNNQATYQGGAIYSEESNGTLYKSTFMSNFSTQTNGGGALYLQGGQVDLKEVHAEGNSATFQGGAAYLDNIIGSISDSNFSDNQNTESNGGGALFLQDCSPTIMNCRFIENKTFANAYGGALKLANSTSIISNCEFTGNQNLTNSGGAVYVDSTSQPTFSNNNFTNNQCASSGAAIFVDESMLVLTDNSFTENIAASGGALYLYNSDNSTLEGNDFIRNSATQFGGAIFNDQSTLVVRGGVFLNNFGTYGGAFASQYSDQVSFENIKAFGNESNSSSGSSGGFLYGGVESYKVLFTNCILSGNKSSGRNGLFRPSETTRFVNCTLYGNSAQSEGGLAILFSGNSVELENCILWNNSALTGNDLYNYQGTSIVRYSIYDPSQSIEGDITEEGNLNADPLFFDPDGADGVQGTADDDFSLLNESPAIDLGSWSVSDFSTTDFSGNDRTGFPDAGALEFLSNSAPVFLSFSSTIEINENETSVLYLEAIDSEGDSLNFLLTGGEDSNLFLFGESTGYLTFLSAPDFENPEDENGDNVYELSIGVSDGQSTTTANLSVTVLDVDEGPATADEVVLLSEGIDSGSGWKQATWFGIYHSTHYPWIHHENLGWLYLSQDESTGDLWMYDQELDWIWTTPAVFPFIYLDEQSSWAYLQLDVEPVKIYDFSEETWDFVD